MHVQPVHNFHGETSLAVSRCRLNISTTYEHYNEHYRLARRFYIKTHTIYTYYLVLELTQSHHLERSARASVPWRRCFKPYLYIHSLYENKGYSVLLWRFVALRVPP